MNDRRVRPLQSMGGRGLVRLVSAVLLAALLQACASAPPSAAGKNSTREVRASTDNADPERRAVLRLELASLYFSRGQTTTALDEVQQALEARPDLPGAHTLRGLIYASLGDNRRSEDSFKRALEISPSDGDAMHNFGWVLCQQQRFTEADALFDRALAQPRYRDLVKTHLAQGVCLARAGRWAEAERSLARSYELDPANPMTAFNLSEVLLRRGELERARFYVARINSLQEFSSAQSLWLAARIERRIGNVPAVQSFGRQLLDRFPQSPEALQYERGRFDD